MIMRTLGDPSVTGEIEAGTVSPQTGERRSPWGGVVAVMSLAGLVLFGVADRDSSVAEGGNPATRQAALSHIRGLLNSTVVIGPGAALRYSDNVEPETGSHPGNIATELDEKNFVFGEDQYVIAVAPLTTRKPSESGGWIAGVLADDVNTVHASGDPAQRMLYVEVPGEMEDSTAGTSATWLEKRPLAAPKFGTAKYQPITDISGITLELTSNDLSIGTFKVGIGEGLGTIQIADRGRACTFVAALDGTESSFYEDVCR